LFCLLCSKDVLGSGVITPSFLASPIDGNEWSASCPGRFIPRERSRVRFGSEACWASKSVYICVNTTTTTTTTTTVTTTTTTTTTNSNTVKLV
jgi:hypothetical protein